MDIAVALLGGQPLAVGFGFIEVFPVVDKLRAQGGHRRRFQGIGVLGRQGDIGPRAEKLGGPGNGLAVIAGGSGNYAAAPFLGAQMGQQVDAAAGLERPQRQIILVLQIDFGVQQLAQPRRVVQGGAGQIGRDGLAGGINIPQGRHLHLKLLSFRGFDAVVRWIPLSA